MPPLSITQTNATKKLLLAFHQSRASATAGDFVVPIVDAGAATFLGLQSKKPIELAVVVYLGKEVSVNDLFAKLIDAGEKIADVERSMEVLTA